MSNNATRLGKGLEALIPRTVLTSGRTIMNIAIGDIRPGIYQPRREFSSESLASLAESIQKFGLNQPILVRRQSDHYEIVAGERRYRACQLANMDTVPAIVKDLSDKETLQLALIENLQREDLNPMEIAHGYARLIDEFQLTHQEIAQLFGKNRSTVSNTLRLLNLPQIIKDSLVAGELTEGHARTLLSLKTEAEMIEYYNQIITHKLNVRDLEKMVSKKPKKSKHDRLYFKEIENMFAQKYAMPVRINGTRETGKIELKYKTADEFSKIMRLLEESNS